MNRADVRIHETADVSPRAIIGEGTSIWNFAQVREDVSIGKRCVISKGVYIDFGVHIGDCVKIQNHVSVFHGVTIASGVFVGPHVCFTNDHFPRAVASNGSPKGSKDWTPSETTIGKGASIGANSTIVCGVRIGEWAMVGAGSVVTHDVPNHGLFFGNPDRLRGVVCRCGTPFEVTKDSDSQEGMDRTLTCAHCGECAIIPRTLVNKLMNESE